MIVLSVTNSYDSAPKVGLCFQHFAQRFLLKSNQLIFNQNFVSIERALEVFIKKTLKHLRWCSNFTKAADQLH